MKTIDRLVWALAFVTFLISILAPVPAADAAGPRRTTCVLRVQGVPGILPLDFDFVRALLASDTVAGRTRAAVLGVEPDLRGDFYQIKSLSSDEPEVVQLALDVTLPETMEASANQFADVLIENLQLALNEVYDAKIEHLRERLMSGQEQEHFARAQFDKALAQGRGNVDPEIGLDPANEVVYRQLAQVVDLSALRPETPFGRAIEMLSHSVSPPLNIVVYWKDLADNADILPDSPVGMVGMRGVRLETGLKTVINAAAGGFAELDFHADAGVVSVATIESLPMVEMETRVHRVPTVIRAMGQTRELINVIQETIKPDSWYALSEEGEGTIMLAGQEKLVIRQARPVHREVGRLLQQIDACSAATLPEDIPPEVLSDHVRVLLAYKNQLQAEWDRYVQRMDERERAFRETQNQYSHDSWDGISTELQEIVGELNVLKKHVGDGTLDPGTPDRISEIVGKVKAVMSESQRKLPVYNPYDVFDVWPLTPPSPTALDLVKRLSPERAALATMTRRIEELDRILTGPPVFDPEVQRIQTAAAGLKQAMNQVADMQQRLANRQRPSVTVLGGTR